MAIAADKNLIAENYGAASKFLLALKARKLFPNSIDKALAECEEKKFSNAVGFLKNSNRVMTCFSVC